MESNTKWRCNSRDCSGDHDFYNQKCGVKPYVCNAGNPKCPSHSEEWHRCPDEKVNYWLCGSTRCGKHSEHDHVCPTGVWYCNRTDPPCPGHHKKSHRCKQVVDTDIMDEDYCSLSDIFFFDEYTDDGNPIKSPFCYQTIEDLGWVPVESKKQYLYKKELEINGITYTMFVKQEDLLVKENHWIPYLKKLNNVGKNARNIESTSAAFKSDIEYKKDIVRFLKSFIECAFAPTVGAISPSIKPGQLKDVVEKLPRDASGRLFLDYGHRNLYVNHILNKTGLMEKITPEIPTGRISVFTFKKEYQIGINEIQNLNDNLIAETFFDEYLVDENGTSDLYDDDIYQNETVYNPKIGDNILGLIYGPGNSIMYYTKPESVKFILRGAHTGCSNGIIVKEGEGKLELPDPVIGSGHKFKDITTEEALDLLRSGGYIIEEENREFNPQNWNWNTRPKTVKKRATADSVIAELDEQIERNNTTIASYKSEINSLENQLTLNESILEKNAEIKKENKEIKRKIRILERRIKKLEYETNSSYYKSLKSKRNKWLLFKADKPPQSLWNPNTVHVDFSKTGVNFKRYYDGNIQNKADWKRLDPIFALAMIRFLEYVKKLGVSDVYNQGFYRDATGTQDTHTAGKACDLCGFTYKGEKIQLGIGKQLPPMHEGHSDFYDITSIHDSKTHRQIIHDFAKKLPPYFSRIVGPGNNEDHSTHWHVELT